MKQIQNSSIQQQNSFTIVFTVVVLYSENAVFTGYIVFEILTKSFFYIKQRNSLIMRK